MKFYRAFCPLLLTVLMLLTSCAGSGAGSETVGETGTDVPADSSAEDVTETTPESSAETTAAQTVNAGPIDTSATLKVLFIGNSFTYYNDMNQPDGIFARIAQNAGYKGVTVKTIYKGGYYLHQFLDKNDSYGRQVLTALKCSVKYDIVIIQEQSAQPIANPADFYDSCREFKALIEANGGQMWLYSTWGYKTGHSGLSQYGPTTEDMEMRLRAAYVAIGEELNVPVIYAGAAMTKSFKDNPGIDLYHTDLKHPSPAGSYLIAWTIFGTIFRVDPATLTYNGAMSRENADALRSVASYIVNNKPDVDEKFKTSSADVKRGVNTAEILTKLPSSSLISVVTRDDAAIGNGWMTLKTDSTKTFSGIRGDKDAIASTAYSAKAGGFTDAQLADIADIGYGISVIGIGYMDNSKKGTNTNVEAGTFTSVGNLVNGHWGSSYMAAMFFDENKYNVNGAIDSNGEYTGLITLNFGKVMKFDAIGYASGSLKGFAQAQDVYVSDNGEDWVKVETACYNGADVALVSVDTASATDPWNGNVPTVLSLCSMGGVSGKYIRIGIIKGGVIDSNTTGLEEINTREIMVYGSEK